MAISAIGPSVQSTNTTSQSSQVETKSHKAENQQNKDGGASRQTAETGTKVDVAV